jgi:hypothetical protein
VEEVLEYEGMAAVLGLLLWCPAAVDDDGGACQFGPDLGWRAAAVLATAGAASCGVGPASAACLPWPGDGGSGQKPEGRWRRVVVALVT